MWVVLASSPSMLYLVKYHLISNFTLQPCQLDIARIHHLGAGVYPYHGGSNTQRDSIPA